MPWILAAKCDNVMKTYEKLISTFYDAASCDEPFSQNWLELHDSMDQMRARPLKFTVSRVTVIQKNLMMAFFAAHSDYTLMFMISYKNDPSK